MRRLVLVACGVLVVGLQSASAQPPSSLPGGTLAPPAALPPRPVPGPEPISWSAAPVPEPSEKRWGVDVILGVPTGARFYRELGTPGESAPEVEAFAGLYIILPTVGAGLRWPIPAWCTENHAVLLRPGVDGYVLLNPFHNWFNEGNRWIGVAAADLDLVWQGRLGQRCTSELGLKVGAGLTLSGQPAPLPIGGLFFGMRY